MSITESRLLELALEYLEEKRRTIDLEISALRSRMGITDGRRRGRKPAAEGLFAFDTLAPPGGKKRGRKPGRKMSEAHRQAISEKMKLRWAERRKAKQ
ncbi:MAG TPA: hypothetical protein VFC63_25395 [Blastocatellia bacterium]|nr:hypothetical protein [Blastocatellia bacterium]